MEEIKNHKGTEKSFNPFLGNFVPQKASENCITASMNQLNIDRANAMSYESFHTPTFSLQKGLNDNDRFLKAHPLTPYPTLFNTKKRSFSAFETDGDIIPTTEYETKRRERNSDSCHYFFNTPPSTGLYHSLPTPSLNVSSTELKRVLESIFNQVDWLEVALAVAKNRAPSVYCEVIEKILQAQIHQLVKTEVKDKYEVDQDTDKHEDEDDDEEYVYVYGDDDDNNDDDEDEDEDEDKDEDEDEDKDEDETDNSDEYNRV